MISKLSNHLHFSKQSNKQKTFIITLITLLTMCAEIVFGLLSKSMALLADGIHMGTHTFAFLISFIAYIFVDKFSNLPNKEKVSNKITAFAGYTNAILLLLTALFVFWEALSRLITPQKIMFNEALLVAIIGLFINIICLFIMHNGEKKDFNFKSVYLHILADVLTSVLAIIAIFSAKYFDWNFLDPIIAIFGGFLILRWSISLIKDTALELLDLH